ncbi:MAG: hypothetical protein JRN39_01770 [Nitrososphaerota archaeon]|nr:hypothetical protein [Nitrososphaerota archaeon]
MAASSFTAGIGRVLRRPEITPQRAATFLGLAIAFSVGLMFRLQMANYGYYLDEFDSYFHYYATSIIVNDINTKGLAGLTDFFKSVDYREWYPVGYNLATTTYAGFYYSSAFLYEFVTRVLGISISLYDYLVIQPAFIGALIVVPVYLIGNRIRGPAAGTLGALFAVVTPGFLARSSLGWYKHEPFSMLAGTMALYFVIESFHSTDRRKSLMYSMLAGLFLGYSSVAWGGGRYYVGITGVAFLVIPLLTAVDYTKVLNGVATLLVTLSIGLGFANPGLGWMSDPSILILALGTAGGFLVTFASRKLPDRNKIAGRWLTLGAIVAIGLVGIFVGAFGQITGRYLSVILPAARFLNPAVTTVAEQQTSSGIELLHAYAILLPLAAFGGYILLKRKSAASLVASLFFLSALYVASSFARLQVFLSLSVGIMAAIALVEIGERLFAMAAGKNLSRGAAAGMKVFFSLAIILMMLVSSVYVWQPASNRGYSITTSATAAGQSYIPDWLQALTWVSENTPYNAKIIAWWDYGYWLSIMGNRTTYIDNGTLNSTRMAEVATMYLSNMSTATTLVKDMGGDYVAVFLTLRELSSNCPTLNQPCYTLGRAYGFGGDDGKIDAMATIAGINISKFLNPNNSMPNKLFWNSTLIGELFPLQYDGYMQIDPTTQQFVTITPGYQPNSQYFQIPVYTYQQKLPPGSSPFELAFQSSGQVVPPYGMIAQVFIYRFNPQPPAAPVATNSST